ncbi:MAG: M48 family metallopeptidase [Bacteroidota bacterium]
MSITPFRQVMLLLLATWTLPNASFAQFSKNYTPIKLSGDVPIEFRQSARDLSLKELEERDKKQLKLSRKESKEYFTLSNYAQNRLFRSGIVYHNDELTEYVNSVAQILLVNDPKLKQELKIFVTRSTFPNASSWRNGCIFFNIGLIKYLDSEAQLAFILAHEITHYVRRHSLLKFRNEKSIERQGVFRHDEVEQMLASMKYSRERELEADLDGMEMLLTSPYDPVEAISALELLRTVGKDTNTVNLDLTSIFRIDSLDFDSLDICQTEPEEEEEVAFGEEAKTTSKAYYLTGLDNDESPQDSTVSGSAKLEKKNVGFIEEGEGEEEGDQEEEEEMPAEEEEEEEEEETEEGTGEEPEADQEEIAEEEEDLTYLLSTHPAIKERVAVIQEILDSRKPRPGQKFLLDAAKFERIKLLTRFESVQYYYRVFSYRRAAYEALVLMREFPNNQYLHLMAAKSLYWYAYYRDDWGGSGNLEEGEYAGPAIDHWYCFLDYLDQDQTQEMVLNLLEDYGKQFPDEDELLILKGRLLRQMDQKKASKEAFRAYVDRFPKGAHVEFAKRQLK